jgi:hypothetical protein
MRRSTAVENTARGLRKKEASAIRNEMNEMGKVKRKIVPQSENEQEVEKRKPVQ